MRQRKLNPFRAWGMVLVIALVYVLDHPLGALPALGRLLDPMNGAMAQAEPVHKDFSASHKFPALKSGATVWFDGRMVPHIHAANDHDLYYIEGYLHAMFRLWQMDMQTRAAAGRISEVVGEKALDFDRKQRRKGMMFAAENSLRAGEANPESKAVLDAYTDGINAWISSLSYHDLPLEYKLMGFEPEPWTNMKTTLLLKYMADDLTGKSDDIALTYLRDVLSRSEFDLLFPVTIAGSAPVIPLGTAFDKASLTAPVAPSDSVAFPAYHTTDFGEPKVDGKGSNNWAVSGSRTASGAPILCNDPHLGLNLPSLWFEVQLQAPGINAYGASLPGAPGIVLGFNDKVSWGFTNNYRDVKDFYEIKPVEGAKDKYWFAGRQLAFTNRVERIAIKGRSELLDTVHYTIHGPVIYDDRYTDKTGLHRLLAVCWMGHRPTNELLAIHLMNHAKDYNSFVDGILHFECPAQNIIYADREGNIALWGQGQFVNKWKGQGRFVMNGSDSSTLWQGLIPMRENPHALNPQRGFLASANESVTDSTYPYWYNGDFVELRAWRINEVLAGLPRATIQDMFNLQQDVHSMLADKVLPVMLQYIDDTTGRPRELLGKAWNRDLTSGSQLAAVFQVWWYYLYTDLWKDKLKNVPNDLYPLPERTMQLILADSSATTRYFPNLAEVVRRSHREMLDSITRAAKASPHGDEWYKIKNTSVNHLAKLAPFSFSGLKTGGWGNTVNAMKPNHGPSWRMVVQMGKDSIEAYGVYPGGQSGNPGSPFYADFLQHWVDGQYYRLLFLPNAATQHNPAIKHTWTITN